MEQNIQLFLDESGDFFDRASKKPPSLVGGIFCQTPGLFTEELAAALLQEAYEVADLVWEGRVHGTELKRQEKSKYLRLVSHLFAKLREYDLQPIIFENVGRVLILDADTTFLHVVADGLTQLFRFLDSKLPSGSKIKLDMVAARRMGDEGRIEIAAHEYLDGILERLHMQWVRLGRYDEHARWQVGRFEIGSARRNYTLMVADLVCNAWFRPADRPRLERYYRPFVFSALQHSPEQIVDDLLNIGAIGQAIYELLAYRNKGIISKACDEPVFQHVSNKLKVLSPIWREKHLDLAIELIDTLIHMEHSLPLGCSMATDLLALIKHLQENTGQEFIATRFRAKRVLLSGLNHQGQVAAASRVIASMRPESERLLTRLEAVNEVCEALIREAVHEINCYAFSAAIERMSRLIEALDEITGLMPLVMASGGHGPMASTLKGKALGTRLQAHMFLARTKPEHFVQARLDSDKAIECFVRADDKQRQYLYRCQLECDSGNYEEALSWLLRAGGADDLELLVAQLSRDTSVTTYFLICHYARLMAAVPLELANDMHRLWVRSNLDANPVHDIGEHPAEIISWKRGTYHLKIGEIRAGLNWHERALRICQAKPHNVTLRTIGFGVLADQCAWLLYHGDSHFSGSMRRLRRLVSRLLASADLPEELRLYFSSWPASLNALWVKPSIEKLEELARTVPY